MHRGMAVIDISTPSNPNEVSFFGENPHSVFEDASGVKVDGDSDGDYAFVVGDEGSLTVINVSNPLNPSIVSSIIDSKLDGAEGLPSLETTPMWLRTSTTALSRFTSPTKPT